MNSIDDMQTPIFPISVAAKILNISVHTLRMYEKEGLIIPFKKTSNHRLYSKADIERLTCIRKAINESKISINGIKSLYSMIPCWQIRNCSVEEKENCEAYNSHSEPCWTFEHEDNLCGKTNCRKCRVYQNFVRCENVKQKIRELI